jgi:hypothetical protein
LGTTRKVKKKQEKNITKKRTFCAMQKFVPWVVILILASSEVCYGQTNVIDSLIQVLANHPRDTNEIKTLNRFSTEFMRKDINKAKSYLYQLVTLAKALNTEFGLSSGYSGLVGVHQITGSMILNYLSSFFILNLNQTTYLSN